VAHHLRGLGVRPGEPVGVLMRREPGLVIALLGILKAGGAYVPMDPAYPEERLYFTLNDARCRFLLSPPDLAASLDLSGTHVLSPDEPAIADRPETNPLSAGLDARQIASVIYTSGSTGRHVPISNPRRPPGFWPRPQSVSISRSSNCSCRSVSARRWSWSRTCSNCLMRRLRLKSA
jgi:non-ribosomal peptide synthetase component F